MAFYGVFSGSSAARARFEGRAPYLCAPALHFSLDGRVALCHDRIASLSALLNATPSLFVATAARGGLSVGCASVVQLYRKYGKKMRRYLPVPAAFALYDAKRGSLLLGAAKGEKCYLEETGGAIFFSSEPYLLRAPIPVDLALIK